MAQKYSAVWIVQEVRRMHKQRLAEEPGWLHKPRIDEIETALWNYWRRKRAALEGKDAG